VATNRGEDVMAGERVGVLPDLDTEFTGALGEAEELLLTLRCQETGDPDDLVAYPAALGGGVALQALRPSWGPSDPASTRAWGRRSGAVDSTSLTTSSGAATTSRPENTVGAAWLAAGPRTTRTARVWGEEVKRWSAIRCPQ